MFAVVTSAAIPCNKMWVVVNDDKQIEVHEKSEEFVLPTIQQYSLNVSGFKDGQLHAANRIHFSYILPKIGLLCRTRKWNSERWRS